MSSKPDSWNSELYQSSHSFVWQYGRDLLVLLNAKPGERILDVGCGTGQLTADITQFGAEVVGIDYSPEMIGTARRNFPHVRFEVADVTALTFADEFDVVLSNAALHWVRDQPSAIASIARALKTGGRLVLEMGGRGNLHHLLQAIYEAMRALGVPAPEQLSPWSFPSIGEYAPLLEARGLEVDFAVLFDRATILEGGERGLKAWLEMFGKFAVEAIAPEQRQEFFRLVEKSASPKLFHNGVWTIDYKRLRLVAVKL
jgi:trans-aconitate 2-methyltransferase